MNKKPPRAAPVPALSLTPASPASRDDAISGSGIELLRDGTPIAVRPIGPGDREDLREGFGCLSKKSILCRFFDPIKRLTESQLDYLTQLDDWNHVALCAHTAGEGPERGVGVARYVRLEPEGDTAECALTVADHFQGLGAGTILFRRLARRAKGDGVRVLRGYLREDNQAMRRILERYRPTAKKSGGGILEVDIDPAAGEES